MTTDENVEKTFVDEYTEKYLRETKLMNEYMETIIYEKGKALDFLVRAGIYTPDGQLAEVYRNV